jgi:hypothetical protein
MAEATRGLPASPIPGAVPPGALDNLLEQLFGGGARAPADPSAPPDLNRGN